MFENRTTNFANISISSNHHNLKKLDALNKSKSLSGDLLTNSLLSPPPGFVSSSTRSRISLNTNTNLFLANTSKSSIFEQPTTSYLPQLNSNGGRDSDYLDTRPNPVFSPRSPWLRADNSDLRRDQILSTAERHDVERDGKFPMIKSKSSSRLPPGLIGNDENTSVISKSGKKKNLNFEDSTNQFLANEVAEAVLFGGSPYNMEHYPRASSLKKFDTLISENSGNRVWRNEQFYDNDDNLSQCSNNNWLDQQDAEAIL
jgi:hypothetical protein